MLTAGGHDPPHGHKVVSAPTSTAVKCSHPMCLQTASFSGKMSNWTSHPPNQAFLSVSEESWALSSIFFSIFVSIVVD
jgi:hypothetical protein